MRSKKSFNQKVLGCPDGDSIISKAWENTKESAKLREAFNQGIIAEIAEFSSCDNIYPLLSPEWVNWNAGFEQSLQRRLGKYV